jgi:hypothetical protein
MPQRWFSDDRRDASLRQDLSGTRSQRVDNAADWSASLQTVPHGHFRMHQITVTAANSAPGDVTIVLESVDNLLYRSYAEAHPLGNELCGALRVPGQVDQHTAVVRQHGPVALLHGVPLHRRRVDATRVLRGTNPDK